MGAVVVYSDILSALSCGNCGIPFAMPQGMLESRKNDGESFWCPNGHKISYCDSVNQQLEKQLAREKRSREWWETRARAAGDQAEAAERRRRAAKGQLTKLRKRVGNGVCPCCDRSFADLARHMATKHPAFKEEVSPE